MDEIAVVLKEEIRRKLDVIGSVTDERLIECIEEIVFTYSRQRHYLTAAEKHKLVKTIFYSLRGLDLLQPLIDDQTITEIMINSHEEIFIEQEGQITPYPQKFESPEKLQDMIQSIVAKVNRMVNEASPIVDARLRDGSRVNIVLPPVALKGPTMTIRKFPQQPLTMEDLLRKGAITQEAVDFLRQLVVAKYNIFISGGTGSGKTTFLNALSNFIPADERIITIEDSAELQIHNIPNLVRMETRNANSEGKGRISMGDLIRASLRMRPNRIIVGEVRGVEALDMLQAMNTGHEGSISTGHSNSAEDMLNRLETMVLSAVQLPIGVIRKQISSAIDIVIHLSRLRDHSRKIIEISEVVGLKDGEIELMPLYVFIENGECEDGHIMGELEFTGNQLLSNQKLKLAGI